MAKSTKPEETKHDDRVPVPESLRSTVFLPGSGVKGETFGGQSDILILEPGEAAGPFIMIGSRLQDLGNGIAPATIFEARDPKSGDTYRMPIATLFRRNAESANLQPGDEFHVRRDDDIIKKRGAGAGNPMESYTIMVTKRAPQAAPAGQTA